MSAATLTHKLATQIAAIYLKHAVAIYAETTETQLISPLAIALITHDLLEAGIPPAAVQQLDSRPYATLPYDTASQIHPISRRYRNLGGWTQLRAVQRGIEAAHDLCDAKHRQPPPSAPKAYNILKDYSIKNPRPSATGGGRYFSEHLAHLADYLSCYNWNFETSPESPTDH
jgi:hypothetical protein